MNDIYIFNLVERRWECPLIKGTYPLSRESFSFVFARKDSIFLFGGYATGSSKNDLMELDLKEMRWNKLSTYGTVPIERQGMAVTKHMNHLIFAGGCDYALKKCFPEIYSINVDSLVWTRINDNA